MQELDPLRATWHITFGTYGTRLHGAKRPTVDLKHNIIGTPFLGADLQRETGARQLMRSSAVLLTPTQREFAQNQLPAICGRGGWNLRTCAAQENHLHVLVDVLPEIYGERVRRLMKRWLGQAMSELWPLEADATWWADQGSNIAIHDVDYLNRAYEYIQRQRA